MFNYELVIKNDKGASVMFKLDTGASKKGTYATISGLAGNKAIPFGKMYVDETEVAKLIKGKQTKS